MKDIYSVVNFCTKEEHSRYFRLEIFWKKGLNFLFQIRIDKVNPNWTASIMFGVLECNPERIPFPFNAMGFRKGCWLVIGKYVYRNGVRTSEKISADLDDVKMGDVIGLMVDSSNNLHIIVEGKQEIIARNVGNRCRALIVLYGEAEQVYINLFN
jgi:neuralized-like protein 4